MKVLSITFQSISIFSIICLLLSSALLSYVHNENLIGLLIVFWPVFVWFSLECFNCTRFSPLHRLLYTGIPISVYGYGGTFFNSWMSLLPSYFDDYRFVLSYIFWGAFLVIPLYYAFALLLEKGIFKIKSMI